MAVESAGKLGWLGRREIRVLNMGRQNEMAVTALPSRVARWVVLPVWRVASLVLSFLMLAGVLMVISQARAENLFGVGGNLQVAGFVSRGLDSSGRTEWELRGDEAKIRGQSTELRDFQIVFRGKSRDDFTLSSPRCRYLHSAAQVKSDAPVFVEGRGVWISGIGYDVYLDARIVMIRSTVTMKIKQRRGSLRKSLQRMTADEKQPAVTSEKK